MLVGNQLPITNYAAQPQTRMTKAAFGIERTAVKGKRVLICDDDQSVVKSLRGSFEKRGWDVAEAVDGREALLRILNQEPDLVVLDVTLPHIDGFEILRQLRNDPEHEDLPVVLVTSRTDPLDVFRGYHLGAAMYLIKPFTPDESFFDSFTVSSN